MSCYVDVHTHLTHEKFSQDWETVLKRAINAGLGRIIVNGLEPESNRFILKMAEDYTEVRAALGIYPLEACHKVIEKDLPFAVKQFNVDEEIEFIESCAQKGLLTAVGECGLDGYWVGEETFSEQERVFERLIDIAMRHRLPIIIHTRKREQRSVEILENLGVKDVNFHCYGGKTKLALRVAEKHGWKFSIPANARKNEAFAKLLKTLPVECILTETDAPFLAPEKGLRNEPMHVVGTVEYLAELRDWKIEEAKDKVFQNYVSLFESKKTAS